MDRFRISCCVAFLIMISAVPARGQAEPSAYGPGHSFWVGGEYSNISASFPYNSGQRLQGAGAFASYHITSRIALDGDARFLTFGGFEGSTERSYLAGPKIFILAGGRFRPYGKFLVGTGHIHYPFQIGDANYFALAPGAGVDYRVRRRWIVRFDYEYQIWHNSPGFSNEPRHQLTPNGFHIGVGYRLFR